MSLAWQMVRHRFAGFAGTFAAIAAGVALVAMAATVWASAQPQIPQRYAESPVLVRSPSIGVNEYGTTEHRPWTAAEARELAARLSAVPGVAAAVPDPAFYVQRVVGGRATGDPDRSRTDGHGWSSAVLGGYALTTGRPPSAAGEVALAGAAPGAQVEVLTAAGPARWTVTGTTDGPGVYVADEQASRMSAGVHVIGLTLTPATAVAGGAGRGAADRDAADRDAEAARDAVVTAVREALGGTGASVLSGSGRSVLEPEADSRIRWIGAQLLIAMVGLGGFVTVFVVGSTAALGAAQRRREIGLLRAVGATPGQVRWLMYAETVVVAVLAGVAGVPLGALTAPLLAGPLVSAGLEPAGFTVTLQPLALVAASATGLVVALAGVAVVARRASRVSPLDALRQAAAERRAMTPARWAAGLLSLAGGVTLFVTLPEMPVNSQSTGGLGAAMLLLTGAALLMPVLIVPLVRLLTWPWRRSATGMLVREGTLTGVRRVAATAAPVLLAVGFTVLLTGTVATIEEVTGIDETAKIPAATVLAPDGTPGLSEAAVAGQPGESRLSTRVQLSRGSAVVAYDAAGVAGAPGLVLGAPIAEELGVRAGSEMQLRWPDGSIVTVPVSRVADHAPAPVVLPRDLVRRHDPTALASAVLLNGPAEPMVGARVMTARDWVQISIDEEGRLIDIFLAVLIGLSVGYTGLAVANTLLMATAARRPEFRALRLAGAATAQVLRVTTAEALLAALAGSVLGAAVAAVSLTGVRAAVEAELEMSVPIVIPWEAAAAITVGCAAVAVLASAIPVARHRAAR